MANLNFKVQGNIKPNITLNSNKALSIIRMNKQKSILEMLENKFEKIITIYL